MRLFVLLMFVFAQLINGSEDVNSVVQPRSLFHRHRHESSTESPFESTTKKHYFNIFHRRSTTTSSSEFSTAQRQRMRDKVRDFFRHSDDSSTTRKHHFDIFHRRSTTPANFIIPSTEKQRMRDKVRDFFHHSSSNDSTTGKHRFSRSSTTTSTRKYRIDGHSTASMIVTERNHRISKQKLKEAGKKYLPAVISAFKQHRNERKEFNRESNVFYCYLENADSLVIPDSVDDEGFGLCEFEGDTFTCPVEITCELYHADSCCQDENGMPYCCKKTVRTNHQIRPPTAFQSAIMITILIIFMIIIFVGFIAWYRM